MGKIHVLYRMKVGRYFMVLSGLLIAFALVGWFSQSAKPSPTEVSKVKVALRDVGHQLLLKSGDSTSRVLPVKTLGADTYLLEFEAALSLFPNDVVQAVEASLQKSALSAPYLVEILQCEDQAVAYSFEIQESPEKSLIPCGGRPMLKQCYQLKFQFIKNNAFINISNNYKKILHQPEVWMLLLFFVLVPVGLHTYKKRQSPIRNTQPATNGRPLGQFTFYPEQHLLVYEKQEIRLSKKECELLVLFAARPNEVISREELSKKVWEDHGVVVGRSLDTYVSKLRKHLQADPNVQLTNVHGVGYRLVVE